MNNNISFCVNRSIGMHRFNLKSHLWWIFMVNVFILQHGIHEEDVRAVGGNKEDVNSYKSSPVVNQNSRERIRYLWPD